MSNKTENSEFGEFENKLNIENTEFNENIDDNKPPTTEEILDALEESGSSSEEEGEENPKNPEDEFFESSEEELNKAVVKTEEVSKAFEAFKVESETGYI